MIIPGFIIINFLSRSVVSNSIQPRRLPDSLRNEFSMTVPEIISKYKYPVEVHHITTIDGYILELHRIPNKTSTKEPVFLMHGILSASSDWILMGPRKGFGYILSDLGYDVWLGNARGNRYSKNHTTLHTKSHEFWNFSWHEIGIYDIPAMIDHILATTNHKKLFHVGHSQGTTTFYVMCAMRPEYNNKIRTHFSLAPVAYVKHMFSPFLRIIAKALLLFQSAVKLIGLDEFMAKDGIINSLGQIFCDDDIINKVVCRNVIFAMCGYNVKQLNTTMLPLISTHSLAGSSSKQFIHYAQEINSGRFCQFDYGISRNLKYYNSSRPSDYDLTQITASIYIFYSKNDWLSSVVDVAKFVEKVNSVQEAFLVSDRHFQHLDYTFGINAKKLVYDKIVLLMNRN